MATEVSRKHGYALQFGGATWNPSDATTYYIGSQLGVAPASNAGFTRIYVPHAGVVVGVYISIVVAGTNGTSETSTISIGVNNSSFTTVSSAVTADGGASPTTFSNTALGIAVVAGDYLEIRWVTPTWATNPLSVRLNGTIAVRS
jgi:hypothetical protein